jgi:RHS repeat-associated protein
MIRRGLSLLLLLALAASTLSAQGHPNSDRGFSPERSYQVGDVDNVNLFNGNMVITLPLGSSYPVGGGLSYGLTLVYNSNVWDFQQREDFSSGVTYTQGFPSRWDNAGLGWNVSLGRLFAPTERGFDADRWAYVGPDGADHVFYPTLHEGDPQDAGDVPGGSILSERVSYSRDGSYLRMTLTGGLRQVEFPDGQIHTFRTDRKLERIEDRFGNWVDVDYADPLRWALSDSQGRVHKVFFQTLTQDGQPGLRVERVELAAAGGATAVYGFGYTAATVPRAYPHNDPALSAQVGVQLLTSLTLPDGSSYQMPVADYFTAPVTNDEKRASGAIRGLRLPTLGRLEWTYQAYAFPAWSGGPKPYRNRVAGVATRRLVNASGGVEGAWTYATSSTGHGTELPPTGHVINTVTDPLGHRTERYFSTLEDVDDYALAFTRLAPGDGAGRFLSTITYNASGTQLRSTYVRYERDKSWNATSLTQDGINLNRRVETERTVYHDDGGRFADVTSAEFDGLGHYRKSATGGNFQAGDVRTTTVNFNDARGIYKIDQATDVPAPGHNFNMLPASAPWVLGTFASQKVEEGGSTAFSVFCHDPATGFLKRKRTLKNNGTAESAADLLEVYTEAGGNVTTEQSFGGDLQSLTANGTTCSMALPGPVYQVSHTYQSGVLATSQYAGTTFKAVDRTIHAGTGLPVSSRDSSGLTTTFEYDLMGRPTWSMPEAGHGGWTESVYTPAQSTASLANVLIKRRNNGSQGAAVLSQSRITFDSFGRVWKEEQLLPGNVWSTRETLYNAAGQKASISEMQAGAPTKRTHFLGYDPFGRPAAIRPPDGAQHDVTFSYSGVRSVSRTSQVAVYEGGTVSEKPSTTTEIYDRQGRLSRVIEPSAAGGAPVTTTYTYDVGNRLSGVSTPASGFGTQSRSFVYDNRGFLLSETHPEKGTSGNGTVTYANYDARGHAGRKTDGPNVLAFTYDSAERLTEVKESGSGGRVLKQFGYAGTNGANDWRLGKLRDASRFNYVSVNGNPFTIEIRETYTYGGRDGRVSRRDTASTVNGGAGDAFTQSFSYTPLGLPNTLDYPVCTTPGCTQAPAPVFVDVPQGAPAKAEIEALYRAEITVGCVPSPRTYCPGGLINRAEMAVFLLTAKEGKGYVPPPCVTPMFTDVPCSSPFAPFVHEMARRGITVGCGSGIFCPDNPVTREQMAIFLLATKEPGFVPQACTTPIYADVPCSRGTAIWVEETARRKIFTGCGGANFCPASPINREQMAGLLVRTFDIPVVVDPAAPRTLQYTYNEGLLGGVNGYATLSYHPNLLLSQVTHTNGVLETQANDPNAMRRPAVLGAASPYASWTSGSYTYDGAGNIKTMGSAWFGYDRVSRLTIGTIPEGQQTYTFDPFGNLTAIGGTNGRTTPTSPATNRLNGAGAAYDAAGNLTAWNGAVYEYDKFNQMTRMASGSEDWSYLYTADDERIWAFKLGANFSRWTLRDLGGAVLREYENNAGLWNATSDYIYRNGQLLAAETDQGRRHYHLDHLGTPRLITDAAGYPKAYHAYYPFGEEATAFNQDTERLKFTGHERDFASAGGAGDDLDYMHARHHSPVTGRFLSVDPVGGNPAAPQSWNRYAYVTGRPLIYTDPNGLIGFGRVPPPVGMTFYDTFYVVAPAWRGTTANPFTGTRGLNSLLQGSVFFISVSSLDSAISFLRGYTQNRFEQMAVEGNNLAALVDYIGLELILPEDSSDLGMDLAMMMIPAGKLGKGLLKGENAVRLAAKKLGLDPKKASDVLHKIKKSLERGGADNVWIDPKNGDLVSPETGEILGNLGDYR